MATLAKSDFDYVFIDVGGSFTDSTLEAQSPAGTSFSI